MKIAQRFLDFYVQSSLHVSLCYVAFYTVVSLQLGFQPLTTELAAVGSSTLVGYNLAKYVHLYRSDFPFKQVIIPLTLVCTLIGLVFVWLLGIYAVVLFSFCGLLTLFYSLPQILGKSFRQIPILKLVTIGLSWSLLAMILPHLIEEVPVVVSFNGAYETQSRTFSSDLIWEFVKYLLFVIALCVPFEIRDLKYDADNLKTLPQLIGVKRTKYIGLALLFACGFTELYQLENSFQESITTVVVLIITALSIWLADKFKSDYYASLFVEAIPVLWLGLYVLLEI